MEKRKVSIVVEFVTDATESELFDVALEMSVQCESVNRKFEGLAFKVIEEENKNERIQGN